MILLRTFLFLTIFLLGNFFPVVSFAQTEPPQFFTLDGRLFTAGSDTDPLLDSNIMMTIQVLDPAKTCVLYEEQQSISTLATNGYFSVRVGSALADPKRTGNDVGNSLVSIFYNSGTVINGDGGCTYTPAAGDERYFRFFITPSTVGATSQLTPDMTLDSVPQAIVAQTLQGLGPSDVFRTSVTSTQAKLDNLLTTNYTALTDLVGGSSTLYLPSTAEGTQLPSTPADPVAPSPGQVWYNSTSNELKYYNGTTVETLTAGGAGGTVTSLATGAGLTGGPITASGTISIATGGVTNAMLATGIDASKITVGTLPVGVVPTGTDDTKLPLLGGTMTGALDMGTQNVLNTGHITMNAQRTITIGRFTTVEQTALIGTLGAPNAGATWFNSDTGKMMYWTGAAAREISEMTTAGGDITSVVAGTGLTGGALTGDATLNVDIGTSSGQLFTIDTVPNCTPAQKLQMSAGPIYLWSCVSEAVPAMIADADNDTRIRAETTADEDTLRFETAGSERMVIDAIGNIGIGTTAPNSRFVLIDGTLRDMSGLQQMPLFNSLQDNTETTGWNEANHFTVNYRPTAAASANIVSLKTSVWPQSASSMAGSTLRGVFAEVTPDPLNSGTVGTTMGVSGFVGNNGSGTITNSYGVNGANWSSYGGAVTNAYGVAGTVGTSTVGTQTMTNARAGYFEVLNGTAGVVTNAYSVQGKLVNSGAITTAYGGYFDMSGAGTIQNGYGIYIGTIIGSTAKYGVYQTDATALNYFNGDVGIGTTFPATQLEIAGTLKIADGGETCTVAANAGMVRYTAGSLQYCNGAAWQTLGISGAGLTSLNGQTGSTQTFANGSTGLTPAFSSAGNTHTLNIPLASGAGVTSGTITKAEYDSFVAKLSAVAGSPLAAARIWVGDGGGQAVAVLMSGDATLSDAGLLTIANNAITTAKINAGAVTDVKLASDAVTSAKILDGTIATADIANSAVTNAKIDTVSVSKITSAAAEYFTYMPAGTECGPDQVLKWNAVSDRWLCGSDVGVTDHGVLTGLSDDDHLQYVMLAGRAGGQNVLGGVAASENLTLESTSHATKGHVILQPTGGNVGIGTTSPNSKLDIVGSTIINRSSGIPEQSITINPNDNNNLTAIRSSSRESLKKQLRFETFHNSDGTPSGELGFSFRVGTEAAPNSVMVIKETGDVGIGTTTPTALLHVRKATETGTITSVGVAITGVGTNFLSVFSVGDVIMSNWNNGTIASIASNTSMTLVAPFGTDVTAASYSRVGAVFQAGNMGIGTAIPGKPLHVSSTFDPEITVRARTTASLPAKLSLAGTNTGGSTSQEVHLVAYQPAAGAATDAALDFRVRKNGDTFTDPSTKMTILGSGNIGIGTTVPAVSLDFNTKTDAVRLPAGADAQRPAATNGMIRYNTTSNKFEGYENGAWVGLREAASGTVIAAGNGAVGTPSLSFSGDPNTGFYSNGADIIGVTTNGVNRFNISSAGLVSSTTGGGLVTSGNGTEAAPTFSFSGDPDTGWWRPTADTMAASTAGVERLRLTSAGYVGIGTNAPSTSFHVLSTEHIIFDRVNFPSLGSHLLLRGANGTTSAPTATSSGDGLGHVTFSGRNEAGWQTNGSRIGASATENWLGAARGSNLRFYTTPNGSGGADERVRIDQNGNVGIGTTSPTSILNVYGGTVDSTITLLRANSPAASGIWRYNTNDMQLGTAGNDNFQLLTNGSSRLSITSGGNVGIGTTIPASKLDVVGATFALGTTDTTANRIISLDGSRNLNLRPGADTTASVWIRDENTNAGLRLYSSGATTVQSYIADGITPSSIYLNPEGGSIGVGTTIPAAKLNVRDDGITLATNAWPGIRVDAGNDQVGIGLFDQDGDLVGTPDDKLPGVLWGDTTSDPLIFARKLSGAGWTELARISGTGLFGIGTNAPTQTLHVSGAVGAPASSGVVSTAIARIGSSTTVNTLDIGVMNEPNGYSWLQSVSNSDLASSRPLVLNPNGANVGIGTTLPNGTLHVAGTSSTFSKSTNDEHAHELDFLKIRGSAIVQNNDNLSVLDMRGYDGTSYQRAAMIMGEVDGTPGLNDMPGRLTFFTTPDGGVVSQERMRIDQAGNIGVGTTTPGAFFHVNGTGTTGGWGTFSATSGGYVRITESGAINLNMDGNSIVSDSGLSIVNTNTSAISIGTNNTQAMYIINGGNVGIGSASPGYKLDVVGDLRISGTPYRAGGDIAWQVPSDERLKNVSGEYERGLSELLQLDMIRFHYKKDNSVGADSSKEYTGVLAQQVEKVIPEAVTKDPKSGFLSLNTTPIFWSLINGVKELYNMLIQQNREISSLQSKTEQKVNRQEFEKIMFEKNQKIRNLEKENEMMRSRLEKIEKMLNVK